MNEQDRKILLMQKRLDLMEQYQSELFKHVLGHPKRILRSPKRKLGAPGAKPPRLSLRIRRKILPYLSFIDRRLVKYRRYNKIRRWIYKN